MKRRAAIALGLGWAVAPASGFAKGESAPEAKTGIKIGEKAPAFKLKDQHGQERSLEGYLKNGKVALVFYRSSQW